MPTIRPAPIPCVVMRDVPVDALRAMLDLAVRATRGKSWDDEVDERVGDVVCWMFGKMRRLTLRDMDRSNLRFILDLDDEPADLVTPEDLATSWRHSLERPVPADGEEQGTLRRSLDSAARTLVAACVAAGEEGARGDVFSLERRNRSRFRAYVAQTPGEQFTTRMVEAPPSLGCPLASIAPPFRTLTIHGGIRIQPVARSGSAASSDLSPVDVMRLMAGIPAVAIDDMRAAIAAARAGNDR